MLNVEEIRLILRLLAETTVVEPTPKFPFRIVERSQLGYSDDPMIGALQAKLSIMLEVASKSGKR